MQFSRFFGGLIYRDIFDNGEMKENQRIREIKKKEVVVRIEIGARGRGGEERGKTDP